eukprot:1177620-Prorocentrum_minimum.AAC.4
MTIRLETGDLTFGESRHLAGAHRREDQAFPGRCRSNELLAPATHTAVSVACNSHLRQALSVHLIEGVIDQAIMYRPCMRVSYNLIVDPERDVRMSELLTRDVTGAGGWHCCRILGATSSIGPATDFRAA